MDFMETLLCYPLRKCHVWDTTRTATTGVMWSVYCPCHCSFDDIGRRVCIFPAEGNIKDEPLATPCHLPPRHPPHRPDNWHHHSLNMLSSSNFILLMYPHLMKAILEYSDIDCLLLWRDTRHSFREMVDKTLYRHAVILCTGHETDNARRVLRLIDSWALLSPLITIALDNSSDTSHPQP